MCLFFFHFISSHDRNFSAVAEGKASITQTPTFMQMTTTVSLMNVRSFFVSYYGGRYAVMCQRVYFALCIEETALNILSFISKTQVAVMIDVVLRIYCDLQAVGLVVNRYQQHDSCVYHLSEHPHCILSTSCAFGFVLF